MVDLVVLQTLSYTAGAISVVLGVIYYALNLREINRTRRITLTSTMMQPFMTEQGSRQYVDLMSMEWSDLDDYKKKYDSRTNPENFAKRIAMWNLCENLGKLYREGMIDLDTLYGGTNTIHWVWVKFKPIIEMYRGTDYSKHAFTNFQYVAEKLEEYHRKKYGEDMETRMEGVIRSRPIAQKTS